MTVVAFDAMGTLFERTPLERLIGKPALEAWFERLLHTAAVLTVTGEFEPFDELARSTYETTAAMLGLTPGADEVLEALGELPPHPEAEQALRRAGEAGEAWVLTNGTHENTERLLERAGLAGLVAEVHTVEEVRAYKPDRRVYELLPSGATLVAAHGWDVAGARAAGYRAIWIDSSERVWPLPDGEPARASGLAEAVELAFR